MDVSLDEYKDFKNNYVDKFFPRNLDTWSSRVLLETINDKELMEEIKKYITICNNDVTSNDLDNLLGYLHKKIENILKSITLDNSDKSFKLMSRAMIYTGLFESIDELSTFCDNLISEIRKKYGFDYLHIIQDLDKSNLSVDGKKVLHEENKSLINDDLLNKYLVLKKWQDINHNFYYESIEILLKPIEENYINNKNIYLLDFKTPLMLYKLNELCNKSIIDIDELSKYYLAGVDKELVKIIGGKGYGLTVLNAYGMKIPETYVFPIQAKTFDLNLNDYKYSVRSSADVEDGEKNSFAGMFDSYLNVDRNELAKYIKIVKNSKNNDRVKKYIEHYGLKEPNLAVVIEKFIEPEYSGVWIGNDINSGVLEYTTGSGEKLVSGMVNPKREIWQNNMLKKGALKCKDGTIGNILLSYQKNINKIADFEWMILDNKLVMLQYRPVTTKIDLKKDAEINDNDLECFSGIPASSGVASGSARFINVKHIKEVNDWHNGDILMAWYTDPEWMNILSNSSGIVTAVGGFLCHSAIIARELGIPCVIGIGGDNMKKIWNEKEITIDGDNGKVYKGIVRTLKK